MWRNHIKCKCMFLFPSENLARKGLRTECLDSSPGPRLNIKTVCPKNGDSHVKDKTVKSLIFNMVESYTGKTTSLYWDGPLEMSSEAICSMTCLQTVQQFQVSGTLSENMVSTPERSCHYVIYIPAEDAEIIWWSPLLLMPWPLPSAGHQQPWYWLCRIGCQYIIRGRVSIILAISVSRIDRKCKYVFYVP